MTFLARRCWFALGGAVYALKAAWRAFPRFEQLRKGEVRVVTVPVPDWIGPEIQEQCGCPDCVAARLRVPPEVRPN